MSTHMAPIVYGVYRIERILTETFRGKCPHCGWIGPTRVDTMASLADLVDHVQRAADHPPLPHTPFPHI